MSPQERSVAHATDRSARNMHCGKFIAFGVR
jgi:hypothetical protein